MGLLIGGFMFVLPSLMSAFGQEEELSLGLAALFLVASCAITFLLQLAFMQQHQTIGKAFLSLRIVSTNNGRPLTTGIIFQREIFAKVLTCYFMCLPVLIGKTGQHDISCETEVVINV